METEGKRRPVGIDLFSGTGGLSLGFEDAGFRIIYALEKDKYAAETYGRNRNGGTIVEVTDILEMQPEDILRNLGISRGDLDIVLGGPPCQGFSIANMRTRNKDNPANRLVFQFCDFVRQLGPKWFVMENVGGLDNFSNGGVKEALLGLFGQAGYDAEALVLDASRFGVPQARKRIFFVGNRINKSLVFLHELASPRTVSAVTVREAIDDLPLLSNANSIDPMPYLKSQENATEYQRAMRLRNSAQVFNNFVSRNNDLVLERYKYIRQGENWRALATRKPELLYNYRNLSKCHEWIYLRLRWDRPSVVISNYRKNMLIHPEQDRGLSVREAARLQSFPDEYIFYGPLGYQQQQVANAVPPLLAKCIATAIRNT
jgi:DNA (cytosine-5)-methyltransferase 1